jgi:hypothetical protein
LEVTARQVAGQFELCRIHLLPISRLLTTFYAVTHLGQAGSSTRENFQTYRCVRPKKEPNAECLATEGGVKNPYSRMLKMPESNGLAERTVS